MNGSHDPENTHTTCPVCGLPLETFPCDYCGGEGSVAGVTCPSCKGHAERKRCPHEYEHLRADHPEDRAGPGPVVSRAGPRSPDQYFIILDILAGSGIMRERNLIKSPDTPGILRDEHFLRCPGSSENPVRPVHRQPAGLLGWNAENPTFRNKLPAVNNRHPAVPDNRYPVNPDSPPGK